MTVPFDYRRRIQSQTPISKVLKDCYLIHAEELLKNARYNVSNSELLHAEKYISILENLEWHIGVHGNYYEKVWEDVCSWSKLLTGIEESLSDDIRNKITHADDLPVAFSMAYAHIKDIMYKYFSENLASQIYLKHQKNNLVQSERHNANNQINNLRQFMDFYNVNKVILGEFLTATKSLETIHEYLHNVELYLIPLSYEKYKQELDILLQDYTTKLNSLEVLPDASFSKTSLLPHVIEMNEEIRELYNRLKIEEEEAIQAYYSYIEFKNKIDEFKNQCPSSVYPVTNTFLSQKLKRAQRLIVNNGEINKDFFEIFEALKIIQRLKRKVCAIDSYNTKFEGLANHTETLTEDQFKALDEALKSYFVSEKLSAKINFEQLVDDTWNLVDEEKYSKNPFLKFSRRFLPRFPSRQSAARKVIKDQEVVHKPLTSIIGKRLFCLRGTLFEDSIKNVAETKVYKKPNIDKIVKTNALIWQIVSTVLAMMYVFMTHYEGNPTFGDIKLKSYAPFIFAAIAAGFFGFGVENILQYYGIPFTVKRKSS